MSARFGHLHQIFDQLDTHPARNLVADHHCAGWREWSGRPLFCSGATMADYPWKNLLPEWVSLTLSSFPNSFSKKLQRPWVLNMTHRLGIHLPPDEAAKEFQPTTQNSASRIWPMLGDSWVDMIMRKKRTVAQIHRPRPWWDGPLHRILRLCTEAMSSFGAFCGSAHFIQYSTVHFFFHTMMVFGRCGDSVFLGSWFWLMRLMNQKTSKDYTTHFVRIMATSAGSNSKIEALSSMRFLCRLCHVSVASWSWFCSTARYLARRVQPDHNPAFDADIASW